LLILYIIDYIFSQIFGAFIAGLVVMGIYWPEIQAMSDALLAAGQPLVFNGGPASILCSFPNATQTNMGYVFMTEFFVDFFIGIVIWSCIDPANPFVSHATAPFAIGLAYGAMVWGFADNTISTNMARDLGTRIVAAIFYGREAFTYMNYSPIAILVNIPATLVATGFYELLMRDSLTSIGQGHDVHEDGEEGLMRHISKAGGLVPTESRKTPEINSGHEKNGSKTE
jgi:glycerol uptake facilitator-like aquaporin